MLNQSGITKVSAVSENSILIAPELAFTLSCKVANTGVEAGSDGKKIVKAGTPLYGSLTARDTAFTISATGEAAKATASVPSGQTGVTAATVNATTFGTAVGGVGDRYTFTAVTESDAVVWKLEGQTANLETYGITLTGSATAGNAVTVVYTPAQPAEPVGIILHDVDVTAGTKNAQITTFGFVDLRFVDVAVAAVLAGAKPAGITLVK